MQHLGQVNAAHMKALKKYNLLILLALYNIHLVLKFSHIPVPIALSSYFADLLCMPILLSIATIFIAKTQQNPSFKLSLNMILFATLYVSLVFEYILPMFKPNRFTSDWGDVFCYGLGASFFWLQSSLEKP